jgi:DNA adenine methylase
MKTSASPSLPQRAVGFPVGSHDGEQRVNCGKLRRPLLRYHGGKWKLAPWIISHFPPHRCYTEVFGGGGSVLLRKQRSYAEVYNDLDGEVVNLFRTVRDNGGELLRLLTLTPFARDEFLEAWHPSENGMEQARRTVIRSFMGFGSAAVTMARAPKKGARGGLAKTGFRANSNRSGTTPAHDWRNYAGTGFRTYTGENRHSLPVGDWETYGSALVPLIDRLRGVVIENKDAVTVMRQHDGSETLHYVDPPYVASTRDKGGDYAFEMTDLQHIELSAALHGLMGKVVLSGYHSALYDGLYADWHRVEREAHADGARVRTEVLWMNYKPDGLPMSLFEPNRPAP